MKYLFYAIINLIILYVNVGGMVHYTHIYNHIIIVGLMRSLIAMCCMFFMIMNLITFMEQKIK
jgi:hypothetical protein